MFEPPTSKNQPYRFDSYPSSILVDLNNRAVANLQVGNYRAAVWDLERALQRLEDPTIWYMYYHEQHLHPSDDKATLRVRAVPIALSDPDVSISQNIFEFYRRGFRIVTNRPEQHPLPPHCTMIVLKFNEAIAYHDDALRCGKRAHFYKALELYQDIMNMVHQYPIQGHLLLVMAIGNNVGHIHAHLLNFSQTREALYWVRQLVLVNQENAAKAPRSDFNFFYKLLAIFNGNDLNAAPAA